MRKLVLCILSGLTMFSLCACDLSADEINDIIDHIGEIKITINDNDEETESNIEEEVEEDYTYEETEDEGIEEEEEETEEEDIKDEEEVDEDYTYEESEENTEVEEDSEEDWYIDEEGNELEGIPSDYEPEYGMNDEEDLGTDIDGYYEEEYSSDYPLTYATPHRDLYGSYYVYPVGNTVFWDDSSSDYYYIGTLTYFDPTTGSYGAMGHDVEGIKGTVQDALVREVAVTECITLNGGLDYNQEISSFDPGELVYGDTTMSGERGVYGSYDINMGGYVPELHEVAWKDEVKLGEAYLISEVPVMEDDGLYQFTIEITGVYEDHFDFTIVDQYMISNNYGMARGMSGTPIIQDGKIVGALSGTWCSEDDIEYNGYGVYIEDMLIESGTIR